MRIDFEYAHHITPSNFRELEAHSNQSENPIAPASHSVVHSYPKPLLQSLAKKKFRLIWTCVGAKLVIRREPDIDVFIVLLWYLIDTV
jgi:hypothetical protein